jgi:hypothetical protein
VLRHTARVRASLVIVFGVASLGCSGGEGDRAADDAGSTEVAISTDSGADDVAVVDAPDAIADVSETRPPIDGGVDAPPDAVADAFGVACEGFSTNPLIPPAVCDKAGGNTSSEKPPNHLYSTSNFGCYRKADGTIYKDPSDNCLFSCGDMGLCPGTTDGPTCEATLRWFTADADRFGCGKRIRLTNCLNGKHAIAVALDRGPNCKNEQTYGVPVIDMSHDLMTYLFDGKLYGGVDKKRILVEEVSSTTKLGPE